MMVLNILLLLITSFLLAASSQPVLHRYHLIQTLATWPDAQSYCKTKYDDLASVITAKDWAGLGSEASAWGLSQPAWLGLYTDTDNWRWSYNDVSLKVTAYNKWSNYNIMREKCGVIYEDGSWGDYLCNDVNPIICYDARLIGAAQFVAVPGPYVTWPQAQTYCRTFHTDIATVTNDAENNLAMQIAIKQTWSWIGLYKNTDWWWLDGNNVTNLPWQSGNPNNAMPPENCATYQAGLLADAQCGNLNYFFCHSIIIPRKQQMLKLFLTSDDGIFNPTAQEAILNLVRTKLEAYSILGNITVTWRLQEDHTVLKKLTKNPESPEILTPASSCLWDTE